MGRRHYVPLRHRYNKSMRHCEDVPLSCLSDVPLRRHWVFQLKRTCDFAGTWKNVVMTSPGCLVFGWVNSGKKNNNRDPELKVSDIVRISNYKNIFGKGYTRNLFEEVFMIKKVKNALPWIYVINDLDGVPNC